MIKVVSKLDAGVNLGLRRSDYPGTRAKKKRHPYRKIVLTFAVATLLVCVSLRVNSKNLTTEPRVPTATPDTQFAAPPFSWNSIPPSKTLQFHSCFAAYQCARLSVPLDWSSINDTASSDHGTLATIAVIKRPALVEVTDSRYAGPIIFNPGGPGNSGVKFLLQYGADFESIFDPNVPIFTNATSNISGGDDKKFFDLITFDPRGVNNSSPRPNCISDPLTRQIWDHDIRSIGTSIDDETVFGIIWARLKAYGAICSSWTDTSSNYLQDIGDPAKYVSSAQVANDMVAIIEQHGRWREERAVTLSKTSHAGIISEEWSEIKARTSYYAGEEKLQYWGFSYGTALGQTFASMFPGKIGRMVLDGNVNADDYANLGWSTNLQDTDAITGKFSVLCYETGAKKCSMFDKNGPKAIANTVDKLLKQLRWDPRWTIAADGSPVIITQTDITNAIFGDWYNAYYGFPNIDKLLYSLMVEDYTPFTQQHMNDTCSTSVFKSKLGEFDPEAPGLAIRCTDGPSLASMTKREAQAHIKRLREQSDLFGENWALLPLLCVGYTARPKLRFDGPFGASSASLYHPILFANPELDPVTPLRNAINAALDFGGSKVLKVQGAMGHCTLSMPSLDAFEIIREYFSTGKLPTEQLREVSTSVKPWDVELARPDNVGTKIWEVVGKFATSFPRSLHS